MNLLRIVLISLRYQIQKWPLLVLYQLKQYRIIAAYCSVFIRITSYRQSVARRLVGGSVCRKPTLVALCPERFRGELEAFETDGTFGIQRCPTTLVYLLNALFVQSRESRSGNYSKHAYYASRGTYPDLDLQRDQLNAFYQKILPLIFEKFQIVGVIAPNFTMPQFDLLGLSAQRLGVPYIILHREGLVAAKGVIETNRKWAETAGKFPGDHLIVHNVTQMKVLVDSGYVEPKKISALGCIRMDRLIQRLTEPLALATTDKKTLVLFSFVPGQGLVGISGPNLPNFPNNPTDGLWQLFHDVHVTVAEIAKENPQIEVLIKTKWGSNWHQAIHSRLREENLLVGDIPNLTITEFGDVHDQIMSATVVTSYGSTTMLEAALADKPVVFPYFAELREDRYREYVFFEDHLNIFDVAKSREEYKEKLLFFLNNDQQSSPAQKNLRKRVFSEFVSDTSQPALERYIHKIDALIENGVE